MSAKQAKQDKYIAQVKNKRQNIFDNQRSVEDPTSSPRTSKSRLAKAGENLKVQINSKRNSEDMASPMPKTPSETQQQKKLYPTREERASGE